jgi:hypothetical protein
VKRRKNVPAARSMWGTRGAINADLLRRKGEVQ